MNAIQTSPSPAPVGTLTLTIGGVVTLIDGDDMIARSRAMRAYAEAIGKGDRTASLRPHVPAPSPVNVPAPVAIAAATVPASTVQDDTIVPCDDSAGEDDELPWAAPTQGPIEPSEAATPILPPSLANVTYEPSGQRVSTVAVRRIGEDERAAIAAGFTLAPPIYAPGSVVVSAGEARFRTIRREVERMPLFEAVADELRASVASERRTDLTLDPLSLRMDERGRIDAAGHPLRIERDAFDQLCRLYGFGPGSTFLADNCKPADRADIVNAQIHEYNRRRKPVVLRTRDDRNPETGDVVGRAIYGVVTPSYQAVDADQLVTAIDRSGVLGDAHTELTYRGNGIKVTSMWTPDHVVDLAAGDIFKSGVRIQTDDSGQGRIKVSAVLWRNRCLNLIIVDEGTVDTVSQVHRGDLSGILDTVIQGVQEARGKIGHFLDRWGHARSVKVDGRALLRKWVDDRTIAVPGMTRTADARDQVVSALLSAFDAEPGDTLADAVNAVTRAAHTSSLFDQDLREVLERQAASLVMIPVR